MAFVAVIESIVGADGACATKIPESVGAVKVSGVRELEAISEIEPPLRSRVVDTEMPSVSNSPTLVVTVYLKLAVLLSMRELNTA